MTWAPEGEVAGRAGGRGSTRRSPSEVAEVLRVCNDGRRAGHRRRRAQRRVRRIGAGATAASCSTCAGCRGIVDVDDTSLVVDVLAGHLRRPLRGRAAQRDHGLTLGHWPQSMALSTVGGWLACRGAGQYSTRYGKIEDMVVGLDVALADGTLDPHRRVTPRRRSVPT